MKAATENPLLVAHGHLCAALIHLSAAGAYFSETDRPVFSRIRRARVVIDRIVPDYTEMRKAHGGV